MRDQKLPVTYKYIGEQARALAEELRIDNFDASIGFCQRFCERHNLTYRVIGHVQQESSEPTSNSCSIVLGFLSEFYRLTQSGEFSIIINMDETPLWVDPKVTRDKLKILK